MTGEGRQGEGQREGARAWRRGREGCGIERDQARDGSRGREGHGPHNTACHGGPAPWIVPQTVLTFTTLDELSIVRWVQCCVLGHPHGASVGQGEPHPWRERWSPRGVVHGTGVGKPPPFQPPKRCSGTAANTPHHKKILPSTP